MSGVTFVKILMKNMSQILLMKKKYPKHKVTKSCHTLIAFHSFMQNFVMSLLAPIGPLCVRTKQVLVMCVTAC